MQGLEWHSKASVKQLAWIKNGFQNGLELTPSVVLWAEGTYWTSSIVHLCCCGGLRLANGCSDTSSPSLEKWSHPCIINQVLLLKTQSFTSVCTRVCMSMCVFFFFFFTKIHVKYVIQYPTPQCKPETCHANLKVAYLWEIRDHCSECIKICEIYGYWLLFLLLKKDFWFTSDFKNK